MAGISISTRGKTHTLVVRLNEAELQKLEQTSVLTMDLTSRQQEVLATHPTKMVIRPR